MSPSLVEQLEYIKLVLEAKMTLGDLLKNPGPDPDPGDPHHTIKRKAPKPMSKIGHVIAHIKAGSRRPKRGVGRDRPPPRSSKRSPEDDPDKPDRPEYTVS